MYKEKEEVLKDILQLNTPDIPWKIEVEGDAIIVNYKWMDAKFFSTTDITDEVRNYTYKITLNNDGTYTDLDQSTKKTVLFDILNGKIEITKSKSLGHEKKKFFKIGFGKKNDSDEQGIIEYKFDNEIIKKKIEDFLHGCGYIKI